MSIYEFTNYKRFLLQIIEKRPGHGRGEHARIAEHLGVNASMVSQVMAGTKDFTLEQAKLIAEYFVLSKLETDYFMMMVQIERAGSEKLKTYYREKLQELKKESQKIAKRVQTERTLSDVEKAIFYSSGLYSAIHLFTSIDHGKTLEEIMDKFNISRTRTQDILQFLVSTGLCYVEKSLYKIGTQSTYVPPGSPFLLKHHTNWRVAAIQKCESLSAEEEMMFTANISISRKDFALVRETFIKCLEEVSQIVKDSPAEDIANLNVDLFWL